MPNEVGRPVIVGNETPSQIDMTPLHSKRRLIRSARNPMDRCTIVSIYPKEVESVNHTVTPGKFLIPAGTYEKPAVLIVGSSSWWKDIDVEQPMLEIVVSSIQMANSIVTDYANSVFGCNMADQMPGLFFTLGEHTAAEVKLSYKTKLDEMKAKQDNWYRFLVKAADSMWARSNNNPIVIWDEMRQAARSLNLNDKPWLRDFQMAELIRCVFCGGMRNPAYPICPVCKAIDSSHPLSKDVKFAV